MCIRFRGSSCTCRYSHMHAHPRISKFWHPINLYLIILRKPRIILRLPNPPNQSFLSLSLPSCGWALMSWLIRTLITVCSESFQLLLLQFDIFVQRPLLIHWSLKFQGVERPNLLGLSCRLRLDCGMTFPIHLLT